MDNEKSSEYIIPKNVATRYEFFTGYGWKELFITAIGLGIGGLIFLGMGIFTHSPFRIVIIALCGGIAVVVSITDPRTGKNIISFIKDYRKYSSTPRRYHYRFGEGRDTFDS